MLENTRKYGFIPEEVYSERGKTADDGTLAKVLFQDVVRQTRLTAGLASVDAANCYDSVAHAITSVPFLLVGVDYCDAYYHPSSRCSPVPLTQSLKLH